MVNYLNEWFVLKKDGLQVFCLMFFGGFVRKMGTGIITKCSFFTSQRTCAECSIDCCDVTGKSHHYFGLV